MDITYPVRPYRADGGFEPSGLATMVAALSAVAAVLGVLASFIGQYFYLIVLYPILIGVALGAVGAWTIERGRIRAPFIAGLLALAASFAAMLAMHYADHQRLKAKLADDVEQLRIAKAALAEMDPEEKDAETIASEKEIDRALALADGTVFDFLDFKAQQGVSISRVGDDGLNLGYTGSWIYWGVEVLIVVIIAFPMMRVQANEPYSVQAKAWKDQQVVGSFLAEKAAIKAAVMSGDFAQLRALQPSGATNGAHVTLATAPDFPESDDVDVKVESVTYDGKGNEKRSAIVHATYPGDALTDLRALFETEADEPAAEPT